jgi:glucokinase
MVTIYRLPYRQGILEDYAAQRGFLHIYQKINGKTEPEKIKVSDIGRWADEGDQYCIQTFQEVGRILAESLEEILIERNIQCLLLGGQISRSFHHMEEPLKQGLKGIKCLHKVSVVKSIDNAALLGVLRDFHHKGHDISI